MSKIRLLNVATPLAACASVVLVDVNPPGPLATAIVTLDVLVVTTAPVLLSISTFRVPSFVPAVPVVGVVAKINFVAVAASKSRFSRHSTAVAGRRRSRSPFREALELRTLRARLIRCRSKYLFQILITALPYERGVTKREITPRTRASRMIPSSDEQFARGTRSEDRLMSRSANVFRRGSLRRFLRISNSAQKTRVPFSLLKRTHVWNIKNGEFVPISQKQPKA